MAAENGVRWLLKMESCEVRTDIMSEPHDFCSQMPGASAQNAGMLADGMESSNRGHFSRWLTWQLQGNQSSWTVVGFPKWAFSKRARWRMLSFLEAALKSSSEPLLLHSTGYIRPA
jgi:hypothetical protein